MAKKDDDDDDDDDETRLLAIALSINPQGWLLQPRASRLTLLQSTVRRRGRVPLRRSSHPGVHPWSLL